MDFKSKCWYISKKTKSYISSDKAKTKLKYFKTSFYAIALGIILGMLIVAMCGYNPALFLYDIFKIALQQTKVSNLLSNFDQTMTYFCVYALMALGLALGFKVGLFNMGGSGQALFGLMFSLMFLTHQANAKGITIDALGHSYIIKVCFIFILSGTLISLSTGVLKVLFNIHEVASSIMLNWIAYYFLNYTSKDPSATETVNIHWFDWGGNTWIVPLLITLIAFVIIYIFVTITKWGFKYKVVGNNPDAATYSGINTKIYTILITAIQGVLMSMGGLFYFFILNPNLDFNSKQIPSIGFDAISVALIAFNNIFGILPVAFIWAIFQVGIIPTSQLPDFIGFDSNISSLIFGIITYCAAIYVIFFRLNVFEIIKLKLYLLKDIYLRNEIKQMKNNIKEEKRKYKTVYEDKSLSSLQSKRVDLENEISDLKNQLKESHKKSNGSDSVDFKNQIEKLTLLKTEHEQTVNILSSEINNLKNIIKRRISEIKQDISSLIETRNWEYHNNSVSGVKLKSKNKIIHETYAALSRVNVLIADYDIYSHAAKNIINFNKKRINKIEEYIENYSNADETKKKYLTEKLNKFNIYDFEKIKDLKDYKTIDNLIKMGALKDYKNIINPYEEEPAKNYLDFEESYHTSKTIIKQKVIDVILENKLFNQKEMENRIRQKEHVKNLLLDIDKRYDEKIKTASKEEVINLKINKFEEIRKVCE